MKTVICTALLLIICLCACGCTGQNAVSSASNNQTTKTPTVLPTATPGVGPGLPTLSTSQPDTMLSLEPGVIVVSFQAKDAQDMHITFLPYYAASSGAPATFSTTGAFNGSVAIKVPQKGDYWVNISSWGGQWTAGISRLSLDTPEKVPLNFTGSGTIVTPAFYLEKGQYIFSRNGTGITTPWYFLNYGNGTVLMNANNTKTQPDFEVNSTQTFRFVTIPESGNYYLQVFAEKNPNPWSVTIITLPIIPLPLGPGPVILHPENTSSR
ncbi:MAG: hypothetical protein PHF57_01535 [Methanoregula sp.]|nr:hypothetical protein [Methanoregula sp.]